MSCHLAGLAVPSFPRPRARLAFSVKHPHFGFPICTPLLMLSLLPRMSLCEISGSENTCIWYVLRRLPSCPPKRLHPCVFPRSAQEDRVPTALPALCVIKGLDVGQYHYCFICTSFVISGDMGIHTLPQKKGQGFSFWFFFCLTLRLARS